MTEEMRKRLEEAAEKDINSMEDDCYIHYNSFTEECYRDGFKNGAKYGYKEAIVQAKKWLKNHLGKDNGTPYFIKAFETDMNKLWEEEK